VIELAKKTVWTIYQEAVAMESDPLRKWATKSHGSERLSAMVKMAKSDQQMWSEYQDFDKNPYLLNFTNGTVDLRTSTLRAHNPADMISRLVPYTCDPYAQAPLYCRNLRSAARPRLRSDLPIEARYQVAVEYAPRQRDLEHPWQAARGDL
jgi:phage/plasmid-associated DNA primase